MKAVGYFRELPDAAPSLADQARAFLSFCEAHGFEVASTFSDTADSDGSGAGFKQLIEYLRRPDKGFVVVVTPSLRSLGDDLADAARRYFQLEGLGASVRFIESDRDGTEALLEAWAEQGSGTLGEKVRAAMRKKAVRGEVLGRPPYGYKVGNRRRLELVPEEAVVVRYIYRLYLHEGLGIRLIARRLNSEGIRTRRGGAWSMVSIRDILRNRAYLGTYSRFGVRVPGSHPALISPEDFHAVQERLAARRTSYTTRTQSAFLLSGLLRCGHCGNKMIGVSRRQSWRRRGGERQQATYRYYQCESRTNQSLCDYHTWKAEALEEEVRRQLSAPPGAQGVRFPRAGDVAAVLAECAAERRRLESRLKALDRKLQRHVDAASRGRLSRERLHSLSVDIARQQLEVEERIEELDRRAREQQDAAERRRRQERALARLVDDWERLGLVEKQELLREVIDHITVTDDAVAIRLRP
ncbi:MAG TPA: recombinase family protein [Dehalococcoidia bacterium]|nr:recombinase family protein [Dehalococcoidia bacterium]